MSWEDNRAMVGQAMRIHNAQFLADKERKEKQMERARSIKQGKIDHAC